MVRRDLGLNRRVFLKAVGLVGIAAAEPAFAQLFVNIQGVGANQFPIAVQPFFAIAKRLRTLPKSSATIWSEAVFSVWFPVMPPRHSTRIRTGKH
jgi:hypothetical protein